MNAYVLSLLLTLTFLITPFSASADVTQASDLTGYAPNTIIQEQLHILAPRSSHLLPRFQIKPDNAAEFHSSFKNGPGRRDYGNKMAYAADRGTALYCGANHNSPHRLNDVWEFHLSSNTWHLISPPASNYYQLNKLKQRKKKAEKALRKGKDVERNQNFLEKEFPKRVRHWYQCCDVKDGYLQAKGNGGPVNPRHTWDGVTYNQRTGSLYWAVLDLYQKSMARRWAEATGRDPKTAAAAVKPASTMYIFDPNLRRWRRQTGEPPFPRMHGMGGTLVYLPDRDVTLWYIAATNRAPNDFGMWRYDAKSNHWNELLGERKVRYLAHKAKTAPGSELQAAYSQLHGKLVAVQKKGTFIYDVESNQWSRGAKTPGFGHDAHGVFAYDSNADVFLLVSRDSNRSKGPWHVHAYDLKTDSWETIEVKGDGVPNDTRQPNWRKYQFAGYYDPQHNVLVLYEGRNARTWVYRHAPTRKKDH